MKNNPEAEAFIRLVACFTVLQTTQKSAVLIRQFVHSLGFPCPLEHQSVCVVGGGDLGSLLTLFARVIEGNTWPVSCLSCQ